MDCIYTGATDHLPLSAGSCDTSDFCDNLHLKGAIQLCISAKGCKKCSSVPSDSLGSLQKPLPKQVRYGTVTALLVSLSHRRDRNIFIDLTTEQGERGQGEDKKGRSKSSPRKDTKRFYIMAIAQN